MSNYPLDFSGVSVNTRFRTRSSNPVEITDGVYDMFKALAKNIDEQEEVDIFIRAKNTAGHVSYAQLQITPPVNGEREVMGMTTVFTTPQTDSLHQQFFALFDEMAKFHNVDAIDGTVNEISVSPPADD